ncbi:MAG: ATP-binding protein, partial [Thermacetogeniaceae bacterium]
EAERAEVIENTIHFLSGFPANNVLLYGDRGTGKSSTVKALLNEFHERGLRLVELPKEYLSDFPEVLRKLKGRCLKFIIFIDDLAFEDSAESYTALKAVLEGGLESRPSNVVVYATSNRRHLIKEKFSDRGGLHYGSPDDEVRAHDTIQEKLSLADRFGITVIFPSPDKEQYLKIVEGIAAKRGLNIEKEQLHEEALRWEKRNNGRSPRTARQFVDWLEGHLKARNFR